MIPDRAVTMNIAVRIVDPPPAGQLTATLRYATSDPYEVVIFFHVGQGQTVPWTLGRDLLRTGLARAAGPGDIRIWPTAGGLLSITLASPDGQARFELAYGPVAEFLAATDDLVPEGTERENDDLDAELATLLKRQGGAL